jgi:hypothetical protein
MLMQFYRVEALPVVLQKGVCYITRKGESQPVSLHFTDKNGNYVHTLAGDNEGVSFVDLQSLDDLDDDPITEDGILRVTKDGVPSYYFYDSATSTTSAINTGQTGSTQPEPTMWGAVEW